MGKELPIGRLVHAACVWEATARKAGNVHRYQDFDDLHYLDLVLSAGELARVLDGAEGNRLGPVVLESVQASRSVTDTNANLGIVLLLGPLALVPHGVSLRAGIESVLARLDQQDARDVFTAIRLAQPGGLGRFTQQDVHEEPTQSLRDIMKLAAARDMIARQYAHGFRDVLDDGLSALLRALERTGTLENAIVATHLYFMATHPDSLIARKLGWKEAESAADLARKVLERDWPNNEESRTAFARLDGWLRERGHDRNPGTSADLVAACLFTALREGNMTLPCRFPWSMEKAKHG